jgi:hypothetical protein
LVLLALLLSALVGGGLYLAYVTATSPKAATIPTFDAGDDVYSQARQKINGFNHDLENHIPATIRLNSDELNTLIAHNPGLADNKILVSITLTNDQARLQTSASLDGISKGQIKDRYVNIDTTFGLDFDLDTRNINLIFKSLQIGSEEAPKNDLPFLQTWINPALNAQLLKDPATKSLINRASTIEIKNGELVIETK